MPTTVTGLVFTQKVLPTTETIAGIILLPRFVAHHRRQRGALDIVCIRQQASRSRLQAKGTEVVAGDELAHHGARPVWVPSRRATIG